MKKNTFYLLVGCIAVVLLAIFWYSVDAEAPLIIEAAFAVGAIAIYLARRKVTDLIEDERSARITEKAAMRTMQVFWVVFCAFSIGAVIRLLDTPSSFGFPPTLRPSFPPSGVIQGIPGHAVSPLRSFGYIQLGLLCLMIFLYVGFRMYYARKFGDFETDEE
ncbi:MAG TPA: DUF2178 domain-containing protein [Methanoregula sp.]|nr:DUF2178 domain-containing protein [Methanoregula sp.]